MTPERWQRIEQLYHSALKHAPNEREDYLAKECGGDEELRREVESLINDGQERAFLDRPVMEVAAEQFVSATTASDLAGQTLGRYEIIARIGAGGMGEVYRARDTRLKRDVALKILPAKWMANPDRKWRFEREARAASALNHPNIVIIHDIDQVAGVNFIVMEYLPGKTLDQVIPSRGLRLSEALKYAVDIASALNAAHTAGIIHRDIKPSNVMVMATGQAKVLDFGLAKLTEPELTHTDALTRSHNPETEEGVIVGTVSYMSPEQAQGEPLDARSDIFSFGSVLFEMVTGQRAFQGKSRASQIAAILQYDPPPLSTFQSLTPPALDHVVQTCLTKDRDARRHNAHDILLELRWIAEGGSQAGLPAAMETTTRRAPWRQAVPWIAIAMVAVAAALAFALRSKAPVREELRILTIPAPENTNSIETATISPDGRLVAMVADGRLWIRPLASMTARPVDESTEATMPFWAPDSSAVGFFAEGKLKRVAATGGIPETLAAASRGEGGAWSEKGFIVYSPSGNSGLYRIPASGGAATQLTNIAQGQIAHRAPTLLPDGRLIYGVSGSPDSSGLFIAEIPASGPVQRAERLLKRAWAPLGCAPSGQRELCTLLFQMSDHVYAQPFEFQRMRLRGIASEVRVPGQSSPVYSMSVSRNGLAVFERSDSAFSTVVALDRSGRTKKVVAPPGPYSNLALSLDGNELVIAQGAESLDLWLHNLERGTASRLTSNPAEDGVPVWSPDASQVAFASWRDGESNLYLKNVHGSAPETRLLASHGNKYPTDWSRDGRYLMYHEATVGTGWDLWVLRTDRAANGTAPQVYLKTDSNEQDGRFSPDGRWVAYVSDEGGRLDVYVRAFPSDPRKWQISSGGGAQPVWRSDGRELYFLSADGRMMAVSVKPGPTFSASEPKPLFPVTPPFAGFGFGGMFAVDPAGETFYVISAVASSRRNAVTVMLNWRPDAN